MRVVRLQTGAKIPKNEFWEIRALIARELPFATGSRGSLAVQKSGSAGVMLAPVRRIHAEHAINDAFARN
jgi:hypothetical protein